MPRTRQYQAPQAVSAQAYGQKGEQLAAQAQMPLPQTNAGPPMPANAGGQITPDILAMAQQFDPRVTPLNAPTNRPGEPVTAGLTTGPGPGPEALRQSGQAQAAADTLAMMARITGDTAYRDMATNIMQSGGYR